MPAHFFVTQLGIIPRKTFNLDDARSPDRDINYSFPRPLASLLVIESVLSCNWYNRLLIRLDSMCGPRTGRVVVAYKLPLHPIISGRYHTMWLLYRFCHEFSGDDLPILEDHRLNILERRLVMTMMVPRTRTGGRLLNTYVLSQQRIAGHRGRIRVRVGFWTRGQVDHCVLVFCGNLTIWASLIEWWDLVDRFE